MLVPGRLTPPLGWHEVFGRTGEVEIEIGCGKGLYLVEAARLRPGSDLLGVETGREVVPPRGPASPPQSGSPTSGFCRPMPSTFWPDGSHPDPPPRSMCTSPTPGRSIGTASGACSSRRFSALRPGRSRRPEGSTLPPTWSRTFMPPWRRSPPRVSSTRNPGRTTRRTGSRPASRSSTPWRGVRCFMPDLFDAPAWSRSLSTW